MTSMRGLTVDQMRQPLLTLVHLDVDGTPPDVVFGGLFVDNTLVLGRATGLLAREVNQGTGRGNDSTLVPDGILVELGHRGIAFDLDTIHVEASLGEVLEVTTDH